MKRAIFYQGAIALALLSLATSPLAAQSTDVDLSRAAQGKFRPAIIPKAIDEGQIVTIFGKRRVGQKTLRLNDSSARSCGFIRGSAASEFALPDNEYLTSEDEPSQSNYTDGDDSDSSKPTFRSNAPYGDASQEGPPRTLQGMGSQSAQINGRPPAQLPACDPSDYAFAAGRAYIAEHDHSLDDAYKAFDAKAYLEALKLFKASYNKMGYNEAAFMVGKMYLFGAGVPQSTEQAVIWLRKVADGVFIPGTEMGFDPADPDKMTVRVDTAMTLARLYMLGYGVPKDPRTAKSWYAKADQFGYIPASYLMGKIYLAGYGGEKNEGEALKFFRKAGQAGYAPAQFEMGFAYYTGAYGLNEDHKVAAEWLMYSAKGGNPEALYTIGRMYDVGDTLSADPQKALVYYKEAALKGQPDALDAIGLYFYNGEILNKDPVTARLWFTQAAKGGSEDAMFNLGVMMAHGEGGSKDLVTAYAWFKLAERSGLDKASAAAKELEPMLSTDERSRAESALQPHE